MIEKVEMRLSGKMLIVNVQADHSLTFNDGKYLYQHLRKFGKKQKLIVLPIIPDADITAIWRIVTLIREYCEELQVVIPERSSIYSTLFALSADKIWMDPFGYLSPLEPYFAHPLMTMDNTSLYVPLRDVLALQQEKARKVSGDENSLYTLEPLALISAQRQLQLLEKVGKNLLKMSVNQRTDDEASKLLHMLIYSYPTVDYPITFKESERIGLPMDKMTDDLTEYIEELVMYFDGLSESFLQIQTGNAIEHAQRVVFETLGRRTVYYEEMMRSENGAHLVEEHSRWRTLTQELKIVDGKEDFSLRWKDLHLGDV
jgi:hypothetical protein